MKNEVTFYSEGSKISGNLYLPKEINDKQFPAIIFCHGFSGIKEILLPAFAEYFAKNGYVCLVFDYRGFGDSEGSRGSIVPYEQMRDIRNAITYMASRGEVNAERIGLWGTSFGGTNAIYAASLDARIKCLTVQIAFADGDRVITGNMTEDERNSFIKSLHKQWKKKVLQNKVLALSPKNILADQQSQDFLDGVLEEFPKADIKIPILTMLHTIEFKPEIYIKSLEIPVLIVGAENDTVNPVKESEILFEKANEPKEILIVKDATHYEIYKPPFFEIVSEKQLAWFNKYL